MKRTVIIIFAAMLAAASCIERDFSEQDPVFSVSSRQMYVPSDMEEGPGLVSDTLWVTSNRGWTARLITDEPGWITLDRYGFSGISGMSTRVPVAIKCTDNHSNRERNAQLLFVTQDGEFSIPVSQSSIRRRLLLTKGERSYDALNPEGETIELSINTNCPWKAALSKDSSIGAALSATSGEGNADIKLTVAENDDRTAGKEGTLIISATGCHNIEIPLRQLTGIAVFRLECGDELQAEEGINGCSVPLYTNVNWTAEIVSVRGYDASQVLGTSGSKGATEARITFPYFIGFGETGEIKVKFTADEIEGEKFVTLRQKPCVRFGIGEVGSKNMYTSGTTIGVTEQNWPFFTPTFNDIPGSASMAVDVGEETEFVLLNGFKLYVLSTKGIWRNSKQGWCFGGEAGNYLRFPAIEGRALRKVKYCFRGTSPFNGVILASSGEELSDAFSTGKQGSVTEIEVKGAQAGDACSLSAKNGINFQIGEMTLYYE